MSDILMTATPANYEPTTPAHPTLFLTTPEFLNHESLVKQHDTVLWQAFNTHGKYAKIVHHADYFCLAVNDQKEYLASAFIIEVGQKWLIEYVMTNPTEQNKGAGSAVMNEIMTQARQNNIQWVILNCDPVKESGKLPTFYEKFGFKTAM